MSTPVKVVSLTNSVQSIVNAPATLDVIEIFNRNGNAVFVQFHDAASAGAVTLNSSVPVWSVEIPAGSAVNLAGMNLTFAAGIQVACTLGVQNATAPTNPLNVANFGYH